MLATVFIILCVIVPAVVLHEYAHGWMAGRLGDPTAKIMGRLTINPLRHIDPVGTLIVPSALYLLSIFSHSSLIMFGWAKPVPVDFRRLHHPKRDMIWVALAGPGMNLILAFLLSRLFMSGWFPGLSEFFLYGVMANLALAFFNLIPIPPLDGSRVVSGVLPDDLARMYGYLEPFGIIIVLLLVNLHGLGFISSLIYGALRLLGLS
jgi:Zn-dependent protease